MNKQITPFNPLWLVSLTVLLCTSWSACSQEQETPATREVVSNENALQETPTYFHGPAWSPDGAKIAYEGRINGHWDLFVMNTDGSGTTRLTDDPANDFRPTWSPDGTQLDFSSKRTGTYDLFVMNADGSNVIRLTDTEVHEANPAWSPDGRKLLFQRVEIVDDEEKGLGLYVLDVVTEEQTQLTDDSEREACWSPDGSKIAYITYAVNGKDFALYTMMQTARTRCA